MIPGGEGIKLTVITILWVIVAAKLVQLWRAPDDRPLRAATGGLISAATAFTLGRNVFEKPLDALVIGLDRLLINISGAAVFFGLLGFFVHSIYGEFGRDKMRRHLGVFGVLLAIGLTAWSLMPTEQRENPASPTTTGHIGPTIFLLCISASWIYALVPSLRYTVRAARSASRGFLRRGLWILATAECILLFKAGLQLALVLTAWVAPPDAAVWTVERKGYLLTMMLGPPALALGLALPVVASMVSALPQRWRHSRQARKLRPLHRLIREQFPDLVLRTRMSGWSVHARRYRRAVEIRDGLTRLGPYYPRDVTPDGDDVQRVAEFTRQAVASKTRGDEPQGPPHPNPGIDVQDLDDEVAWLIRLARILEDEPKGRSVA